MRVRGAEIEGEPAVGCKVWLGQMARICRREVALCDSRLRMDEVTVSSLEGGKAMGGP